MNRGYTTAVDNARGFSLLEVMVTVLVLSVGLLGLAAMQIDALKGSHNSQLRNQATALAYEIGERIRSNRAAAANGDYDITAGSLPTATADCEASYCSSSEMASYDLSQWKAALASVLPAGDGAISRNEELLRVAVFWDERRSGASGTGCDPDNPDDLACLEVSFIP